MEFEPILRLSDEVIGQIAAGEVVERPAAAVKELVENSIDAGATQVTVELKDGGITYLRVSDNGRGIPAAQVRTAFERHTTSKLRTADELFAVRTLGFRGEALASIAAVARVTCVSRTANAEFGIRLTVEAGQTGAVTEAASPQGTSITVRDLFINTPVRLKFLKKPAAEGALVSDYIMRLILSRPDIAFRFVSQGKTVYRSAGDGTLASALYCVYGKDALQAMHRVHGVQAGVMVEGFVGVGELARGNRLQQSFFINGRYFRDEAVSRALEFGCEGHVMIGRYPMCALMLTMPYQLVDVNVHPNKLQVRFQNPQAVAGAVEELTRDALAAVTIRERLSAAQGTQTQPPDDAREIRLVAVGEAGTVDVSPETSNDDSAPINAAATDEPLLSVGAQHAPPALTLHQRTPFATLTEEMRTVQAGDGLRGERSAMNVDRSAAWVAGSAADAANADALPSGGGTPLTAPRQHTLWREAAEGFTLDMQTVIQPVQGTLLPDDGVPAIRFIGAVFQTYLLFEAGERLLMVDQHAAHERVLYDRFMARYEGATVSQRLLAPQLVRLTARDVSQLAEMDEALSEAGFEVEAFDATSAAVRAVPVILGESVPLRELLLDVLDEVQAARGKLTRERLRRRVTQMACKHAIKAGDALRPEDVHALLSQMLLTGAQPTCPHGRPIVSELTQRDLEKRFKRIP